MGLWIKKKSKARVKHGQSEIVVANNPTSIVAEQFRTIRTNIQFSMVDRQLKTLNVTSAGPSSGKSVLAANLAAAFANDGKKVLLVDADMRRPTVHKVLQKANGKGLSHLLTDRQLSLNEVIQLSDIPNLYYLTCGVIPPNPSELLSTTRMVDTMDQLKQVFDLIIFDNPPVLSVTDAQIMSTQTDGTIFVIPYGQARKDEVKKAAKLLEQVNANVLGAVMNFVDKQDDHYYYYGEAK
ncbi:polysaccharide biosynthesis tyrosine autokinase [Atopobacter sp. AH10]|uniref:CpsD/CapB family tyrosine-protein kinase n=1 Tax=Atopobacter sp. AH10 TaxID=2315861 RepID=UPI000EF25287|nr:CpsD/CapB family tyrosine-protein kinase [Atopobacter sp. AH10]RLK63781.1 polysaccharide biosynthesis tyrosine autokinase [Atopobacter sp. AH10]